MTGLLFFAAVDCGTLATPQNGQVTLTTTTFMSTATYSCNSGYNLSENETRTCLANEMWSSIAPTCDRKCSVFQVNIEWWAIHSPLQLWIVGLWPLLKMARSLSLQLHSCQLQLTVVIQGTFSLGMKHAPVWLMGCGQTLHPPVIVSAV